MGPRPLDRDALRVEALGAVMEDFLFAFLNWQIIQEAWPILWDGLKSTLMLSAVVVPLGILGGVILAVLSTLHSPWVRWPRRHLAATIRPEPAGRQPLPR